MRPVDNCDILLDDISWNYRSHDEPCVFAATKTRFWGKRWFVVALLIRNPWEIYQTCLRIELFKKTYKSSLFINRISSESFFFLIQHLYDRKKFTRDNFQIEYFKNTLTFPYPYAKCESNYIRIYTRIHRLIELSVYLVIIRSIMSTFHATSLTLFRQVRFFIRNHVMFGYLALPANYIISCSQSLKNSPWPPHKVTGTTHKTLRL